MVKRRKSKLDRLSRNPKSNREQVKDPERRSVIKALVYGTAALSALALSDKPVKENQKTEKRESKEQAITPPEITFEKDEGFKKPVLAKELNEDQIKKIAEELREYCDFHLKNVEKLVNDGRMTDDIMGKVVMALIRGADQIFLRSIPGFEGFKSIVRSWKGAARYINEFLEYEGKFLLIYQVGGEKIVNMYNISDKHKVISGDIGNIGRQLLLKKPRLNHYKAKMQCSVPSSNTKSAICFDENVKRYVDVNQSEFAAFDRTKGLDEMNKEVYESSRYHEAAHIYHYKKYPKFKKLRHTKGPKRREAAQIDELCALAAELSKANDLMGALSLSGSHMPEYRTAHKIFVELMNAKIGDQSVQNDNRSTQVFYFIKEQKDTKLVNEVGREMYEIGIKKLEALIAE